jgi:hypothetical protein
MAAEPKPRNGTAWRALTLDATAVSPCTPPRPCSGPSAPGCPAPRRTRRAYLAAHRAHVRCHERRVHSQNGEDGLFKVRRLGVGRGTLAEFGASDGSENCTRHLLELGWSRVWIEDDQGAVSAARQVATGRPVRVVQDFLTVDRIRRADANVQAEPDLLVVDVDGNDWGLAREVLREYRLRYVLVEVKASMGREPGTCPTTRTTTGTAPGGIAPVSCRGPGSSSPTRTSWRRASRPASTRCSCVGGRRPAPGAASWAEPAPGLRPAQAARDRLRAPGCAACARRGAATAAGAAQLAQVLLTEPQLHTAQPGSTRWSSNGTGSALDTGGQTRGRLSVRLSSADPNSPAVPAEPERSELATEIGPGARRWCPVRTTAPELPGTYTMSVTLVQEHVALLDDVGTPAPLPPVQVQFHPV